MPRLVLILTLFLNAYATKANVLLIHPATADIVVCSADNLGVGARLASLHVDACVDNFTAVGYVEAEKLTPEQKKAIGTIIQQRKQFIPRGSLPAPATGQ